ncbi:hypothetical protein ElyMa_005543000 [Elysia marginata]|uniref:C2H2-type domain-containing protein n=1 Tax=Elysia marginata TaxID=1093978 RepID=A0AAV4EXU3_9GAST|nr:hypothetical protein ElyMa_005543000 [Elysia marginata]
MKASAVCFMFAGINASSSSGETWKPGLGCPVHGCRLKVARDVFELRRHWKEKHEEITAMFHCSACSFVSKRRYGVIQHYRQRHDRDVPKGSGTCIGSVEYQHNKEFIDPHPFTLESLLR